MAVIRGTVASIKWQYYNAAAVDGYTVSAYRDGRWELHCRIANADGFKMRQKPLIFVAPTEKGVWRWPITDIEIREDRVTATLGPPLP